MASDDVGEDEKKRLKDGFKRFLFTPMVSISK